MGVEFCVEFLFIKLQPLHYYSSFKGFVLINYFRMLDTKILSSEKTIVVNRK